MHAIRQYEFGPPEVLRYEEVPDPHPVEGQVRIAVAVSGVHLIDTSIRNGERMGPMPLPELPMTPGREVAGRVDAVGEGVDPAWVGKRVVAHLGAASGGYAEYAVRDVAEVHELPDAVTAEVAVAMVGTGRTTLGILDRASLSSDDVVLVPSAAGGIGTLLVQAARNAGAFVAGLAGGAAKVERVRANGAQVAVDYTDADWPERVRAELGDRRVSVVFDGVGGEPGRAALELLGPGGRIVLFGWSAGQPTQFGPWDVIGRGITVTAALGPQVGGPNGMRELSARALTMAADGSLRPEHTTFPLADATKAHTALKARETVGKVLLVP